MHTFDLSVTPFGSTSTRTLPLLPRNSALWWYVGSIGAWLAVIGLGVWHADPWMDRAGKMVATNGATRNSLLVGILICGVATYFIGMKQWRYYYTERHFRGQKEGIFEEAVRVASPLEYTLDIWLCVAGGALTASVLMPVTWYATLACYSLLVLGRSSATLMREALYSRKQPPDWLAEWDQGHIVHRGLVVRYVLEGWCYSHALLCAIGLVAYAIMSRAATVANGWTITGATLLSFTCTAVLYRVMSKISYKIAESRHR